MLAIRMQRTGRKGHAMFRVVVQDSRWAPTSGKFVAMLGSYDPHAKTVSIKKDRAQFYLDHGAQPSERVARLFTAEGVKMPDWVTKAVPKERTIRNPEKLRKNRPAEEAPVEEAAPAEAPAAEAETEAPAEEAAPAETEAPKEEA